MDAINVSSDDLKKPNKNKEVKEACMKVHSNV